MLSARDPGAAAAVKSSSFPGSARGLKSFSRASAAIPWQALQRHPGLRIVPGGNLQPGHGHWSPANARGWHLPPYPSPPVLQAALLGSSPSPGQLQGPPTNQILVIHLFNTLLKEQNRTWSKSVSPSVFYQRGTTTHKPLLGRVAEPNRTCADGASPGPRPCGTDAPFNRPRSNLAQMPKCSLKNSAVELQGGAVPRSPWQSRLPRRQHLPGPLASCCHNSAVRLPQAEVQAKGQ